MNQVSQGGLQLTIKLKNELHKGCLPSFSVTFTNIGGADLTFCTYMLKHRMLTTMWTDTGFEVYPFRPTPRNPLTQNDFKCLSVGESVTLTLDLNKAAQDGYGLCWAGSLPPVVDQSKAIPDLPAGKHVLTTFIGPHVSFYDAPEGSYDHKKSRLEILKDVPTQAGFTVPQGVWNGELTPQCELVYPS
jgi:hypothetical protein